MPQVRMPDGVVVAFPDDMPPEQIKALIAQKFPDVAAKAAPSAPQPSPAAQEAFAAASAVNPLNRPAPNKQASSLPGVGGLQDTLTAATSGASQGMTFGWGDEIMAAPFGLIDEIGKAVQGQGFDLGRGYGQALDKLRGIRDDSAALNPTANMVGEIAGALPAGGMAGGQIGLTGPLLRRMVLGAGVGAGQGALYAGGKADQDKLNAALWGGGIGAGIGAVTPAVTNWVSKGLEKGAQRSAVRAAAKTAETADELKTAASQAFEAATGNNPVVITDNAYMRLLGDIKPMADKLRLNSLEPQSVGLMEKLMSWADDLNSPGSNLAIDLKDLHILRQQAQAAAQVAKGPDKLFTTTVINKLDDFIKSLKPGDMAGGVDPSTATKALFQGINGWNKANKVAILEEAIRKGEVAASGAENGIRNAFRSLIKNPKVFNRFSPEEQRAIRDVVEGTFGRNLLKLMGKFGFTLSGNNALGGFLGGMGGLAAGGPVGAAATALAGTAARKGSEVLTQRAADTAMRAAGAPSIRSVPMLPENTAGALERLFRGAPAVIESQR